MPSRDATVAQGAHLDESGKHYMTVRDQQMVAIHPSSRLGWIGLSHSTTMNNVDTRSWIRLNGGLEMFRVDTPTASFSLDLSFGAYSWLHSCQCQVLTAQARVGQTLSRHLALGAVGIPGTFPVEPVASAANWQRFCTMRLWSLIGGTWWGEWFANVCDVSLISVVKLNQPLQR